jgi:hypothetical protein
MSAEGATVRLADESDISAVLSLLLTSFRQFPLFAFLYAPLDRDLNAAYDTVFFWRRRLQLGLIDPLTTVLVAEVPASFSPTERTAAATEIEEQSWRMLEWTKTEGKLSQASKRVPGKTIIGFAIWRNRQGFKVQARPGDKGGMGWGARLWSLSSKFVILPPYRAGCHALFEIRR